MKHPTFKTLVRGHANAPAVAALLALFAASCGSVEDPGMSSSSSSGGDARGCAPPKLVVLATDQENIRNPVLDATNVYWTTADISLGQRSVRTMPKGGGAVTTLVSTSLPIHALAVDDVNVYWSTGDLGSVDLHSMPKKGGQSKQIGTAAGAIMAMTVNEGQLYWTQLDYPNLMSMPVAGAEAPAVLGVAPSQSTSALFPLDAVVVDHQRAFWTTRHGGNIYSVLKSGGEVTDLGTGPNGNTFVADDTRLLWGESEGEVHDPNAVKWMPKSGGTPAVFASTDGRVDTVAVDASCVYWLSERHATIMTASKSGGEPALVAHVVGLFDSIVADETGVYWTDPDHGTLVQAAK